MRIYFNSLSRPKRVARTLQDIFPLEKLSQCQAWAARCYGYRDWHELAQVTAAGLHPPPRTMRIYRVTLGDCATAKS